MLLTLRLVEERFGGVYGYVSDWCALSGEEIERVRTI